MIIKNERFMKFIYNNYDNTILFQIIFILYYYPAFFPMLMVYYTIYSIEKIYTEKPCFDIEYGVLSDQGAQIAFFKINQV